MKKTILFSAFIFNAFIATAQWQHTNGPCGGIGTCFVSNGPDLFVSAENGVYKSTNNGNSWTVLSNGLPLTTGYVLSVGVIGTNIVAGMDSYGIYLLTNNGNNWSWVSGASHVSSFATDGTNIFAAAHNDVLLSADSGNTWTTVSNGLPGTWINALAISGTSLFAGTDSGVFISANNGTLWTHVGLGNKHVKCFAINGTSIFAGTNTYGVYKSTNNGGSWTQVNSGISNTSISCLTVSGTTIFAGTMSGIYKSTNNGSNWQTVNSGLITLEVRALYATATGIFAGHYYPAGISRSTNNGSSWITINDGIKDITIDKLVKTGSYIIAAPPTYLTSGGGGVFLSTDNGDNWRRKGLASYDIRSLAASGTTIFAGTRNNGLYFSTDTGSTWVHKAFNNSDVCTLVLSGTDIFAYNCSNGVIYFSSDSGNTWTADTNGIGVTSSRYLWVDDSIVFASGNPTSTGVLISTDYGASWTQGGNGLSGTYAAMAFANIGSNIFAGTGYDGTYISTDTGITWTSLPGLPGYAYAFAVSGTTIFAASCWPSPYSGVYMSSDTGSTWLAVNDSLTDKTVLSLAIDSTYLFAGTQSSVFRRPLSDLIPTGIKKINKSPGVKIYPNPASTIITISTDNVLKGASIEIFNLFGEKVYSTVFKNKQQTINIKTFQAGIYFVKVFDGEKYYCRKIIIEQN